MINRISNEDEESCILFELLNSLMEAGNESVMVHIPDLVLPLVGAISKFLPPNMEPWPQVCFHFADRPSNCYSYSYLWPFELLLCFLVLNALIWLFSC